MSILFRGSFDDEDEAKRRKKRCDMILESYHNDPMRLAERIADLEHQLAVSKAYVDKLKGQVNNSCYQD